jgi:hypothetical protein
MSISPIAGPSSSPSSDLAHQNDTRPSAAHETLKTQQKAPEQPPAPPTDQVELSERSRVSQLANQGENPSQIAAHLGLSVSIVESDLFPTDVTSLTALPALDLNA